MKYIWNPVHKKQFMIKILQYFHLLNSVKYYTVCSASQMWNNAFEKVVCKMSVVFFRPYCLKWGGLRKRNLVTTEKNKWRNPTSRAHVYQTILPTGIWVWCSANERRRYILTSSLIGWAHTQNDPCHNKFIGDCYFQHEFLFHVIYEEWNKWHQLMEYHVKCITMTLWRYGAMASHTADNSTVCLQLVWDNNKHNIKAKHY